MFIKFSRHAAVVLTVSMLLISPQSTIANHTVSLGTGLYQDPISNNLNRVDVFQAAGPNQGPNAVIQSAVDTFRASLGGANNGNAPGPLAGGRREINWDGGAATTASPAVTPFIGFQNIRGAVMTTPGSGFLQTPINAPELLALDPSYENIFNVFSPQRIFVPVGDNVVDVYFFVPGTTNPGPATPATVSGFGAVFTDVDRSDSTKMEYFDRRGRLLFGSFVPPSPGRKTLSFLGVVFRNRDIFRVRITNGNTPLGSAEVGFGLIGQSDIVAMDDFIYSEPQAVETDAEAAKKDDLPES